MARKNIPFEKAQKAGPTFIIFFCSSAKKIPPEPLISQRMIVFGLINRGLNFPAKIDFFGVDFFVHTTFRCPDQAQKMVFLSFFFRAIPFFFLSSGGESFRRDT